MRPLLATCTVYTWLIGRVSTVTGTVDTRPIAEFFVVSPAPWMHLPLGVIKFNWDSALDRGKHLMGVGVIAQDSECQVVASMCSVQYHIFDSAIAEAYGARQALEFGRFLDLQSIFLEGDALEITTALGRMDDEFGKYGNLIMDARRLFRGFHFWNITYVRREGNMVAYDLLQSLLSLLSKPECGLSFIRLVYRVL
jgi:hypothetical protein